MSERTPSCATGATSTHPPKVRLGEVATYINGYAFKPTDWSDVGKPSIRIQDLTGNSYQMNRFLGSIPEKYDVVKGDVLISWSASLGVYVWNREDALLNQHIFKVIFDEQNVDKRYFFHQVGSILKMAASEAHGCTMKHLTKPVFDALPFVLPPLVEQQQIATRLDRICEIVEKRKAQLAQLQQLVKSRFVEMFGDPVANEMRWPMVAMNDVLESIGNGRSFVCESFPRIGENPAILKLGAATWGEYRPEENKALKHGDSFFPDCEVKADDLLFTRKNTLELVGKCAYVRATPPKLMLPDLIFRLETNDQIDKVYLASLINCDRFRGEVRKLASGSAGSMPNISKARLLALRIILPPLALQREFAAFVAKVDRLEAAVKKGLAAAERLYRQQLQEVFDIADNIADNIGDHRTRDHRTRDHRTRDHRTRDNMPQPQLLKEGL